MSPGGDKARFTSSDQQRSQRPRSHSSSSGFSGCTRCRPPASSGISGSIRLVTVDAFKWSAAAALGGWSEERVERKRRKPATGADRLSLEAEWRCCRNPSRYKHLLTLLSCGEPGICAAGLSGASVRRQRALPGCRPRRWPLQPGFLFVVFRLKLRRASVPVEVCRVRFLVSLFGTKAESVRQQTAAVYSLNRFTKHR